MTKQECEKLCADLRSYAQSLTPAQAKKELIAAGIINENFELAEPYR